MRWTRTTDEERYKRLSNCHKWFAWHPVGIGKTVVWLETVERIGTLVSWPGDYHWLFSHRLIDEPKELEK